jgi:hypothetical protein
MIRFQQINQGGGVLMRPINRRDALRIGAAGVAGLMLGTEPAEAGSLDFLKRLARAVGFITGPRVISKMFKGAGLDATLKNAVDKQLAALHQIGFSPTFALIA